MAPRGVLPSMPCVYPDGPADEWCERHQKDHAFVAALRTASA